MTVSTALILRLEGYLYATLYALCIPLGNWMLTHSGTHCDQMGICVIPVWPGILAPSSVLVIGATFTLRDLVQRRQGPLVALGAIVAGCLLSVFFASPGIALASGLAFLVSQSIDMAVFTLLAKRSFMVAVGMSNMIGLIVDSLIFLDMAYGSISYMAGETIGKLWMTVAFLPFVWLVREMDRRRSRCDFPFSV